jgi:hypothetical protein
MRINEVELLRYAGTGKLPLRARRLRGIPVASNPFFHLIDAVLYFAFADEQ